MLVYPLAVVSYSIGVFLLIKYRKVEFPDVNQTWYSRNGGTLGTFTNVDLYFNSLNRFGPGCGYFPEPSKIILIVHPDNLEYIKRSVLSHDFKVCTGARYLGVFIRDDDSKCDWIKVRMQLWEHKILKISKTAGKYPQESYAVVLCVIQS